MLATLMRRSLAARALSTPAIAAPRAARAAHATRSGGSSNLRSGARATSSGGASGRPASSMAAAARDELIAAVRVGAPLYNAGRPDQCYQTYRGAAQRLAAGASAEDPVGALLRRALVEAADAPDPSAAAWALRRAFDAIIDGVVPQQPAALEPLPPGMTEFPVLDCSGGLPAAAPQWQVLDDVVMGGASSSALAYDEQQRALVFKGRVTTAFNGGFASVRSLPWGGWAALGRGGGLRLVVRGDGQTYKLNLKTDDGWDGVAWQADFPTGDLRAGSSSGGGGGGGSSSGQQQEGEEGWQVVDLPWSAFLPTLRGRVVPARAPLSGAQVRQLGFMLSKVSAMGQVSGGFREGDFALAVRAVRGIP